MRAFILRCRFRWWFFSWWLFCWRRFTAALFWSWWLFCWRCFSIAITCRSLTSIGTFYHFKEGLFVDTNTSDTQLVSLHPSDSEYSINEV